MIDRIDMINESKKLLDDNFSLINKNMSKFIVETNQVLKKMRNKRHKKMNDSFNMNNYNNIFSENNNNYYGNNDMFIERNNLNNIDKEEDFVRKVYSVLINLQKIY